MTPTESASAADQFHVAIVGSGPSGFYSAEALMRARPNARIDMYDRLPTPFGLVRGGVAPDHPKIKQVCLVYDRIAQSQGFSFYGNVTVGKDLTLAELQQAYHAVIVASGVNSDRRLGIPGEDLPGCHTATEFVGWYNGHPDYRDCTFDLSHETAVIIGQGNVAADVARILATSVDELRKTDIAEHAIEVLARSQIRNIFIVGRRGPAQAKFTAVELKELGTIAGCRADVSALDMQLNPESEAEIANKAAGTESSKNVEIFRTYCHRQSETAATRHIYFRFLQTPVSIERASGALRLTVAKNSLIGHPFAQTNVPGPDVSELTCGVVFRSVGYRGLPFPGLEFDEQKGTISNHRGRCYSNGVFVPGIYVTGWIKRGPTGVIGTNRADSVETVEALIEDLDALTAVQKGGSDVVYPLLASRSVKSVNYSGWKKIDVAEQKRGQGRNKPREKFTRIDEMVASSEAP